MTLAVGEQECQVAEGMEVAVEVLDERKAAILKAIVQDYVTDGEPIASKRIVDELGLGVSAATVRSDMAALEAAGFIAQPHTSAGRVPTDAGYRYFVDSLTQTTILRPEQRAAMEGLLLGSADLEDLLRRTSNVLSQLTRFTALVAAPRIDKSRLRHIELVQLGPASVLAVFIADTGRVEKRILDVDTPVADHDVQRARHVVNEAVSGLRLVEAPDVVSGLSAGAPTELRSLLDGVAAAIRTGLVDPASAAEHVFVGGTARLAGAGSLERLEQLTQVYEMLEDQVELLAMIREALEAGDPAVRIGTELSLVELAAFSVVASSYGAAGDAVGTLGVLGPTRMDYPQTMATVQAVASLLERALAELTGG